MMQVDPRRDRLMDVLLREELGGKRPPDLTARIVASALDRRRCARVLKGAALVAATVLVAVAAWHTFRYPAPRITGKYDITGAPRVGRGAQVTTTDGSASLVLGGYCRVAVHPKSALRIEGKKESERVFLGRGELTCNVDGNVGAFAVHTELGTVSVTGTRFIVRVSRRKGGDGMFRRQMFVKVLVGAVLVSGLSGEFAVTEGEERTVVEQAVELDAGHVRGKHLPMGIHGFEGYLIGKVVTMGDKGFVVKVDRVDTGRGNEAKNPDVLVGRTVRVLYASDEAARKCTPIVKALKEADRKIVVTAWTNKTNTMLLTNKVDD